jgi:hypothetical protein
MHRMTSVRTLSVAVIATVAFVVLGTSTVTAGSVDDVSPLSGPPGTVITVAGLCDNPGFDEEMWLTLNSDPAIFTGDIVSQTPTPVSDPNTGAVAATIMVPASAAPGTSIFVYAFCAGASGSQTVGLPCIDPTTQCAEFVVTETADEDPPPASEPPVTNPSGTPPAPLDVLPAEPAASPAPAPAVEAPPRVTG